MPQSVIVPNPTAKVSTLSPYFQGFVKKKKNHVLLNEEVWVPAWGC